MMDILEKYITIVELDKFYDLELDKIGEDKIKNILKLIDLNYILGDNFIEFAKHSNNNIKIKAIVKKLEESHEISETLIEIVTDKSNVYHINFILDEMDKRLTVKEYLFCYLNHSPDFKFLIGYYLNLNETLNLYLYLTKHIKYFNIFKFILFINFIEFTNENEFNGLYELTYERIKNKCLI